MDFNSSTVRFEQWLLASGYQVSPKIKIADLRAQAQGRGIIALEDIPADEVLFSIPRNVLLNIETGTLASLHPQNKEKLMTKYDHWEGLILTILFELSLGQESRWAPYLSVLPHEFHSLMFWNDSELELLKPSLVVSRIGREKAEETYRKLFPSALEDLGIPNLNVSLERFHQVASTILSYSFDVERPDFDEEQEDDEQVKYDGYFKSMVALADTLNADTKLSNANLFYETDFLVMKSVSPIAKGEQVYNTYGDHPNAELLRRYGYVEWEGSKFDFGELPLSIIHDTIVSYFDVPFELIDKVLELISEADVEEIEEDVVLDSYDAYSDGEVLPEAQILIQTLVTIAQMSKAEGLQNMSREQLSKSVNRALKKCYQLVESKTMTKNAVLIWEQCLTARLSEYPSHAYRDFTPPQSNECFNKLKMSERILASEVASLQVCLKTFADSFKLIDDERLLRNVLKRKANSTDLKKEDSKRQKV